MAERNESHLLDGGDSVGMTDNQYKGIASPSMLPKLVRQVPTRRHRRVMALQASPQVLKRQPRQQDLSIRLWPVLMLSRRMLGCTSVMVQEPVRPVSPYFPKVQKLQTMGTTRLSAI